MQRIELLIRYWKVVMRLRKSGTTLEDAMRRACAILLRYA